MATAAPQPQPESVMSENQPQGHQPGLEEDCTFHCYSEIAIQPASTTSQPSSDQVNDSPRQIEIHPYAEIAVPSTNPPDLTEAIPCQDSSLDENPSSTGSAVRSKSVAIDVQQMGNNSLPETPTIATTTEPEPTLSDPIVSPYAEVSILPASAQPNLTAVEEGTEEVRAKGDNLCPEIPSIVLTEPPIMEDDINPYAEITIQPQPTTACAITNENTHEHSMDLTDLDQSKRRLSLDPRHFYTSSNTTPTPPEIQQEAAELSLSENRGRRRLSLGARLFLKSTASSGQRSGAGRRRLSLGVRSYHRAATAATVENDRESTDFVDLLTSLRSSGVSFQTDNSAGPKLRKKVMEVEVCRGDSLHTRRRMTVGARFFHRPLLTTDKTEGSPDGGSRRRRMSIGARFSRKATVASDTGSSRKTSIRRRLSIGARLLRATHSSPARSHGSGSRLGLGARFFRQFAAVPEDSSCSTADGGKTPSDGATISETKKTSRIMNLGTRLLHKLRTHDEPLRSTASSMLNISTGSTPTHHEEKTSTSGSEQDRAELTELLAILRSSGVSFPTNRILEARQRARSLPPPPPPPPPLSDSDSSDCHSESSVTSDND